MRADTRGRLYVCQPIAGVLVVGVMVAVRVRYSWRAMYRLRQRLIWRMVLPSAVRRVSLTP